MLENEKVLIVAYGKKMSGQGLTRGTSGNLSIYNAQAGLMAISPSGIGYFDTHPEDIVVMDLEGKIVEGKRKPSSEWSMHAAFYKAKPWIGAVVHTHSTFCTTFACLGKPLRAVHYVIGGAGVTEVPVAPYRTFGTPELAEAAIRTCGEGRAVLLGNHGMVALGADLREAFDLAVNLEFVAEMQYRTASIGNPRILTDAEMAASMERARTYGQDKKK